MSLDLRALLEYCADCGDPTTKHCAELGHRPVVANEDFEWRICDRCRGEGTLGGYPGVYTSDDFAEDPDLFEDYMTHRRRCEPDFSDDSGCGGTGKVLDLSEAARARPFVAEWINSYYEMRAEEAAERRMGA